MIENIVAILAFAAVAVLVLQPRVRSSAFWRATITPLASIIGSGFLVSLPLLAREVGANATAAMAGLLLLSYLLGGAIRFNIAYGEPLFAQRGDGWRRIERLSRIVLGFAYFISVTYYLSLLGAFVLKAFAATSALFIARLITSILLVLLGAVGFTRGLRGLESIEEIAVGLKLAVIAAVIAALALLNATLVANGAWAVTAHTPLPDLHQVRIVLGLLIVVQGFETSRFLKDAYPAQVRIRSMRLAQLISAAIYLSFFALSFPILRDDPPGLDVAGVTDMVRVAAGILPAMLIAGAVFAQISAAIADAIGGAGLVEETAGLPRKWTYLIIAGIGLALVWLFDVFKVIQLASGAFAIFYGMQSVVAAFVATQTATVSWRWARIAGFVLLALIAFATAVFGISAEGG